MRYAKRTLKSAKKREEEWDGARRGAEYQPWLKVHDVPSIGRSTRRLGHKVARVYHLLSDHERSTLDILEWDDEVVDIREQYALLPRAETEHIARALGIRYPRPNARTGVQWVMTTDFVVTRRTPGGLVDSALSCKPESELERPRVLELFEIERLYWAARHIRCSIITEQDCPRPLVRNLRWVMEFHRLESLPIEPDDVPARTASLLSRFVSHPEQVVTQVCGDEDSRWQVRGGTSLCLLRHLIATKAINVDLSRPIELGHPVHLLRLSLAGSR